MAILLSLEAVFAALGGWWLLGETYDTRTMLGCGLMLAGIVASQAPRLLGRRDSSGTETGTGDSES